MKTSPKDKERKEEQIQRLKDFNMKPPIFAEEKLDYLLRQKMANLMAGRNIFGQKYHTEFDEARINKLLIEIMVNKL